MYITEIIKKILFENIVSSIFKNKNYFLVFFQPCFFYFFYFREQKQINA